jgi:pimeloyl-ACP methyl ester carboxylesterase
MSSEATQSDGKAAFTERYVPRDHGRVYARDYEGAGPTFVLMHGFPDNLRIYDDVIPHLLQSGRRIVAFDFRASAPRTSRQRLPTASGSNSAIWKRS